MDRGPMRRPRRHPRYPSDEGAASFEPRDLTGLFSAPRWLRDLGRTCWLAVGVTLFVVAAVWILSLTQTIVTPVLTAAVVAAVVSPLVDAVARRGTGRGFATAFVFLGLVVLVAGVVVLVVGGITSQADEIRGELAAARQTIAGWANDVGIDASTAVSATDDASSAVTGAVQMLLQGLGTGIKELSSLAFFLSLTALSLFFLLKDGPVIRGWAEQHMRVPAPVAHRMMGRVLESLRGYFLGVTLVAAFNAVVVGLGAIILGVPLPGTVAAVTFLGAYVPYLGAWGAGAFAVLIALGGAGADAAAGMIVIQLLANGVLQQLVQPVAYGAALGIHPLAVLIVTIAAGSLFGAVGLILAAPLTSAATRIAGDLAHSRSTPSSEVRGRASQRPSERLAPHGAAPTERPTR
jgi:putative heme transporter